MEEHGGTNDRLTGGITKLAFNIPQLGELTRELGLRGYMNQGTRELGETGNLVILVAPPRSSFKKDPLLPCHAPR